MIGRRSALYKCSRNSSGTGVWSDGEWRGWNSKSVARPSFFLFFFSFLVLSKETREKLVNGHHERSLKIDWCLSKARQNVIFFFFFLISLLFRLLAICWLAKKNVTAFVELQTLSADVCPHTNFYKIYRTPNNV